MAKLCLLTGVDEKETPIKKMCVNCKYSRYVEETDNYVCNNEQVMEVGFEKVKEAAKGLGFDIDTLTLKPMTLKAPLKKCDNHSINIEAITTYLQNL
jgi:hypothetical protein